jgi:hypothetical protein
MQTIQGGKVCINVNSNRTQFFGYPLSLILFNLVAETLTTLLRKATQLEKVKGLVSHLISEGITHIQYADDTILMVESDDTSIINMKFILYYFE